MHSGDDGGGGLCEFAGQGPRSSALALSHSGVLMAEGHRATAMKDLPRLSAEAFVASDKDAFALCAGPDSQRPKRGVGVSHSRCISVAWAGPLRISPARPPHRDILKTALGATDHVEWVGHEHTVEAIRGLQSKVSRSWPWSRPAGQRPLRIGRQSARKQWAVVLGNEVRGCARKYWRRWMACLEIPQFGVKHSLNVSVAAGMVCWQAFRAMGPPPDA